MRSSLVVRASDCQCTSCNGPGFNPSIRRHSGIWVAADEAVPNIVWRKILPKNIYKKISIAPLPFSWGWMNNWTNEWMDVSLFLWWPTTWGGRRRSCCCLSSCGTAPGNRPGYLQEKLSSFIRKKGNNMMIFPLSKSTGCIHICFYSAQSQWK